MSSLRVTPNCHGQKKIDELGLDILLNSKKKEK